MELGRKRKRGTCLEGQKREERRRCALEKREYALGPLSWGLSGPSEHLKRTFISFPGLLLCGLH